MLRSSTAHSSDSTPDDAWGESDAGDGVAPPRRGGGGGGWGRSSILGASWQRAADTSPESPEPSASSRAPRGADSPKKRQVAKKSTKKSKPVADDLGSWMYILGSTRSSMQARNMANSGLLQQMHARMDAQDERRRAAERSVADAVGGYAHLINRTHRPMISDGAGGTAGLAGAMARAPGNYSAAAGQTWGRSAVVPAHGGAGGGGGGTLGEVEGDLTVEETSPPPTRRTWGRSSLLARSTETASAAPEVAAAAKAPSDEGGRGRPSAAASDGGGSSSADENLAPTAEVGQLGGAAGGVSGPGGAGGGSAGSSPVPRAPETPPPPRARGRSALLAEKVNGATATATAGA